MGYDYRKEMSEEYGYCKEGKYDREEAKKAALEVLGKLAVKAGEVAVGIAFSIASQVIITKATDRILGTKK